MLLTLDVGNTNITLGVYAGDTLRFVSRMATNPPRMEDQYAADLLAILKLYGVEPEEITGVIMSSVVPGLTAPLTRAVRRVRNVEPFIVSAETVPDLKVRRDMPNTLGADLIVGAVAAKALYSG
ncbi:MAG: type III pantothenate kinase, partial [Acutalibacteraceae bacterium]